MISAARKAAARTCASTGSSRSRRSSTACSRSSIRGARRAGGPRDRHRGRRPARGRRGAARDPGAARFPRAGRRDERRPHRVRRRLAVARGTRARLRHRFDRVGHATRAGEVARAGGWGWHLGDEGSGFWIGVRAVREALRAADGRGPATRLEESLISHFEIARPEQILRAVYDGEFPRHRVAAFAVRVEEAALAGDEVARSILAAAANELVLAAASVRETIGARGGPVRRGPRGRDVSGGADARRGRRRAVVRAARPHRPSPRGAGDRRRQARRRGSVFSAFLRSPPARASAVRAADGAPTRPRRVDRGLDLSAGLAQEPSRPRRGRAPRRGDDALRAVGELLRAARVQVHHPGPEDAARGREGRRRDLVERELRGGSGLQARRARQDLGPDAQRDDDVGQAPQRRGRVRGHQDRAGPAPAAAREPPSHERRHRAGRDADDEIAEPGARGSSFAIRPRVLGAFAGAEDRAAAARHERPHARGAGPERRRQLGRFQHAEPAARAGPEDQAVASGEVDLAKRLRGAHDVRPRPDERLEDAPVLGLHASDDARRIETVEARRAGVDRLGRESPPNEVEARRGGFLTPAIPRAGCAPPRTRGTCRRPARSP